MEFREQLAVDAAVFLNPSEFAESVNWNGQVVAAEVSDIEEGLDGSGREDGRDGVVIEARSWTLQAGAVPMPKAFTVVTVDGVDWEIPKIEQDCGFITVHGWRERG